MIKINNTLFDSLTAEAKKTERQRKNYNFHENLGDPVQRLLNALEPDTYVRPHRHLNPDKVEIFFVLKGRMVLIEFDEDGLVTDHMILDPLLGQCGCEIKAGVWHSLISLESGSIAYEVKEGPFTPISDENFAPWSPESKQEEIDIYLKHLKKQLGLIS